MFEVNLVPELKHDAIRALRTRNIILFVCIAASLVSLGIVLILLSIKGGQDITMASQDGRIDLLSSKLNAFSDLNEILTIQDQASNLSTISAEKNAISRIFGLLVVMQDRGQDSVTFSAIDLTTDTFTMSLEGQVDARTEPYIDYRVLEEFKKNTEKITYDYGNYVDAEGNTIPAYCISDTNEFGDHYYSDYYGAYYAIWNFKEEGCNPGDLDASDILSYNINPDTGARPQTSESQNDSESEQGTQTDSNSSDTNDETNNENTENNNSSVQAIDPNATQIVIYRTPLFDEWVDSGNMDTSGQISGVPHFNSNCITYRSSEDTDGELIWTEENQCLAVPDGVTITDSSNGTNQDDELVLRFDAQVPVDPEMFLYSNQHMMWYSPTGANVTDSFVQLADMFAKRAEDCAEGDETCENITNSTGSLNTGGQN